jgi:[acyl-carrier-protein] S-malonyltransferase
MPNIVTNYPWHRHYDQCSKVAFVFPGQGIQSLGLLASFKPYLPQIKSIFEKASNSIGDDLWEIAQKGPITRFNQTVYTQPILLTASIALWELWRAQGGRLPDFLLGHSLGEYSAYACAGSFDFEAIVYLVSQRGKYMQSAVSGIAGAMAVLIGLSHDEVAALCKAARGDELVTISNYNTHDQVVISGHVPAVERVMQLASEKGARFIKRLPVSVPAHCELMQPAVRPFAIELEKIRCRIPHIPVVSNAYSTTLFDSPLIKQSLVAQLYQPVYWVDYIHYLLAQGVNCFVECGPGRVLTRLMQSIAPGVCAVSLGDYQSFQNALVAL